jgi:hypothetical protein
MPSRKSARAPSAGLRTLIAGLCGALVAALGACATGGASAPTDKLVRVQSVVRAAEALGAEQDPRAVLHLKLAQEQLAVARQLIRTGKHSRARNLLERAHADAELAMALTRQTAARREAEQVQAEVLTLLRPDEPPKAEER